MAYLTLGPKATISNDAPTTEPFSQEKVSGVSTRSFDLSNTAVVLALFGSIAAWFFSIRSPLWLDETISYWQISAGISQIWARQGLSSPVYAYLLWITKSLFGSNEAVLRMPSVIVMLAATYMLYRIAREFFVHDVAMISAVVFCLHPTVAFAAVDARPYACAVLLINCAIFTCIRWARTNSTQYAILLGASTAGIFYLHYLFGIIIPALVLAFLALKTHVWKDYLRNVAVVGFVFALLIPPVIPGLLYLFRTSQSHVFAGAPVITDLLSTVAPGHVIALLCLGTIMAAAMLRKLDSPDAESRKLALASLMLAAVPLIFLYDVSVLTPVHVFVDRYRLVALPGVALCWAFLMTCLNSKAIRASFCIALVTFTLSTASLSGFSLNQPHGYSWKYALERANQASTDNAPLLICSDLPESNTEPMPSDVYAATNGSFAPLSYYKVHSPVIPLPRALNDEAISQVNKFLATAIPARRRFLVLGFIFSNPTIAWITDKTRDTYVAHSLGSFQGVTVMEYTPR